MRRDPFYLGPYFSALLIIYLPAHLPVKMGLSKLYFSIILYIFILFLYIFQLFSPLRLLMYLHLKLTFFLLFLTIN